MEDTYDPTVELDGRIWRPEEAPVAHGVPADAVAVRLVAADLTVEAVSALADLLRARPPSQIVVDLRDVHDLEADAVGALIELERRMSATGIGGLMVRVRTPRQLDAFDGVQSRMLIG